MRDLIEGLQLIDKYSEPGDRDFCFVHDKMYAGDYEKTYAKMSPEERARMKEMGWFEDEESWAKFS